MSTEAIVGLYVFMLAIFVGFEVISKVPSTLHTPLMSGANAIALPEKLTAPIMRPSIELIVSPGVAPAPLSARVSSRIDTRAAAPPPAPLNKAIICGIAVIFTTRAP